LVDPPRLRASADSPSERVRALELSRADLPSSDDLSAIASNLAAALPGTDVHPPIAAPPLGHPPGSVRPVASGGAAGSKLLGAAAIAAAIGAGVLWQLGAERDDTPLAPAIARPTELVNEQVTPGARRGTGESNSASASSSPLVEEHGIGAPPVEQPAIEVPAGEARPGHVVSPSSPARAQSPSSRLPEAQWQEGSIASSSPSARSPAESGSTEIALLSRAQRALRSEPKRALELAAEHEQRFPGGALVHEREFIAIQALLGSNRSSAAAARARRFRNAFPDSAHLRRLDQLFGDVDESPRR
jgi:hypothetical protein